MLWQAKLGMQDKFISLALDYVTSLLRWKSLTVLVCAAYVYVHVHVCAHTHTEASS